MANKMIRFSALALIDIPIREADYSKIFDGYNLTDKQIKYFIENHNDYNYCRCAPCEYYTTLDKKEVKPWGRGELHVLGIDTLRERLEKFVKDGYDGIDVDEDED